MALVILLLKVHGDLVFRTTNSYTERLRIKSSGEVSIGGFTPTAGAGILQIAGGLRVDGSASASIPHLLTSIEHQVLII